MVERLLPVIITAILVGATLYTGLAGVRRHLDRSTLTHKEQPIPSVLSWKNKFSDTNLTMHST